MAAADGWGNNAVNMQSTGARLSVFNCPSNSNELGGGVGNFTYALNMGTSHQVPHRATANQPAGPIVDQWTSSKKNGFSWYHRWDPNVNPIRQDPVINMAAIKDGTSNTAAYSEFVIQNPSSLNFTNPSKRELREQVYTWVGGNSTEEVRNQCLVQNGVDMGRLNMRGASWASSFMGHGNLYAHNMMPNEKSCHNSNCSEDWMGCNVMAAGSEHPGGVTVGLGDGAVRFVSETVSQDVWWAVGTRRGGESATLDN
jgi:hypothetical protein